MSAKKLITVGSGCEIVENTIEWYGSIGSVVENHGTSEFSISNEFNRVVYKQCGYKVSPATTIPSKDFQLIHVFNQESFPSSHRNKSGLYDGEVILLFGKVNGKAGSENKYEFPPPIDNTIYYGKLCLVKVSFDSDDDNDNVCDTGSSLNVVDLSIMEWEKTYAALFGGFYDCDEDDSEDEDDIYDNLQTTRNGYAKDGFVVDDDDSLSEYDDDDDFCLSDED